MSNYEKQAADFLAATDTVLTVEFLRLGWMDYDEQKTDPPRAIYRFTLTRGSRNYSAEFGHSWNASARWLLYGDYRKGQSVETGSVYRDKGDKTWTANPGPYAWNSVTDWQKNPHYSEPTAYDILACLDGFAPDTFADFCADYGYDTDSRSAERTFNAVRDQVNGLRALYSDSELEQLAEIA